MEKVKFFAETLGFSPVGLRLKQAMKAIFGEEDVPRTKFGLSSLSQLHPSIAFPLWRGKHIVDKKVILSNLFNHTPTPIEDGWSVQKTQASDYRGKDLTYNSHNGTDLAVPIGTTLLTAAPGEIVMIKNEFNRGGLKIFIDHGKGVMTCSVHLARALVKVGDIVKRGQPIAITGYSGLDGMITCPFGVPHVHYNVWHNGIPVCPFGVDGETTLWRNAGKDGTNPIPFQDNDENEEFEPSQINEQHLKKVIASCKTQWVRDSINKIEDIRYRAFETIFNMNYYPTRFSERVNIYDTDFTREHVLDLPFYAAEYDGVILMDEILKP